MIIWLASYPKSGNTWIRSFINSILFTKDGSVDLNLKIGQYPLRSHFKSYVKNMNDLNEISKFWEETQTKINLDNKVRFFKTHHVFCNINGNNFTNFKNTLGVIHIVRDPRNVITSILNHYSLVNYTKAFEFIIDNKKVMGLNFQKDQKNLKDNNMLTLISSWKNHYNSWKNFPKNNLLIKYEELVTKPETEFKKIINFLENFLNIKLDKKKIDTSIKLNSFLNLKKIEEERGFIEAPRVSDKIKFFHLGPENKWENFLSSNIRYSIEKNFKKEMKELGYL